MDIPLPGKYRYLAETGVAGPLLPGGGLVEALPLPQTKQSRWRNSTHGLAKQPRRRSPGRPEKGCTSLILCKAQAALPNQPSLAWFWLSRKEVWLASGWLLAWLLAGFLVGHPPAWKNLVLTWLLDLPAAWGRPCGGTAPPTNEAK